MLGLRPACDHQQVTIEYNKSLKFIHPDNVFLDGAAEAFMMLQPSYTDSEWNDARALQGWSHPSVPALVLVNSDSLRPSNR